MTAHGGPSSTCLNQERKCALNRLQGQIWMRVVRNHYFMQGNHLLCNRLLCACGSTVMPQGHDAADVRRTHKVVEMVQVARLSFDVPAAFHASHILAPLVHGQDTMIVPAQGPTLLHLLLFGSQESKARPCRQRQSLSYHGLQLSRMAFSCTMTASSGVNLGSGRTCAQPWSVWTGPLWPSLGTIPGHLGHRLGPCGACMGRTCGCPTFWGLLSMPSVAGHGRTAPGRFDRRTALPRPSPGYGFVPACTRTLDSMLRLKRAVTPMD